MRIDWRPTVQLTFSGRQNSEKKRRIPEAAAAVLLGAALFRFLVSTFGLHWSPANAFSGGPLTGLLSAANSIADRLGAADYTILPKYAAGMGTSGEMAPQGLFLTIAFLLLCALAWLILRSGVRWLLLIPLIPAAALLLGTGITADPWSLTALCFALACCYAFMTDRAGSGGSWWLLALPAAAAVASLCIGLTIGQATDLDQNPVQSRTAPAIEKIFHSRLGSNPLGNGDLEALDGQELARQRGSIETAADSMKEGTPDETKTALTVSSEAMDAWYLRGFIGEQYDGRRWEPLSNAAYYRQRDDLYWLNRQGFDGLSQMMEASAVSGQETEETKIAVETEKADRSLIYLPYETSGTEAALPAGTQNYAGAFLKSDRRTGTSEYTVSCGANMTGSWTDRVGRLYEAENTETLRNWFVSESNYNVWCYGNDLQIPDEAYAALYEALGDPGDLSRDHAPYGETIKNVTEYLDRNFIYSEDFGPLEDGQEFVTSFIERGKGCDAHYASLAALMFRYYGIPARYVEGYLVTPSDARAGEAAGGTASIGYSRDHAWTEIYIDGFGWVPLEVTPEYQGIMPEADLSRGLQSIKYKEREQDPPPETEEDLDTSADSPGGRILGTILMILLILLLLALAAWLLRGSIRRQIAWRNWKKAFEGPNPRRAVCAMYGYMNEERVPISERALELGNMAAYSRIEISERDRRVMKYELERGKREKKQMAKENRRTLSDRLSGIAGRMRRK